MAEPLSSEAEGHWQVGLAPARVGWHAAVPMLTAPLSVMPARARKVLAPAVAMLIGLAAIILLGVFRSRGSDGFVTDPLATASLTVGAVATATIGTFLVSTANRLAARYAQLLSASLLAYLAASAWAVWAVNSPTAVTPLAVSLWNTLWIPPLVLAQLTASASVRRRRGSVWEHVTLVAATGVVGLVSLLTETATDPFAGIATVAPEAWTSVSEPLGAVATTLGMLALLLLPVRLWVAALTSNGASRARLGVAAAGATAAPMTVVFCLVLAVVRNPGSVDPSIGSAAFLIAVAACASFAAVCSLVAARGGIPLRHVLAIVRMSALCAAAIAVVAVGTLVASPALAWGPTAQAATIASMTVVIVAAAWFGSSRLASVLLRGAPGVNQTAAQIAPPPNDDQSTITPVQNDLTTTIDALRTPGSLPPGMSGVPIPASAPYGVPSLTPRESDVLALLAEGSSNSGIAAQLVVSERTVDAHLRAIFVKLDLDQQPSNNRRVQAARLWLGTDS